MTKDIKIDMGAFARTVTAQLDNGPELKYDAVKITLSEYTVLFRPDWLRTLLDLLVGPFYKSYGGWLMEIEISEYPGFCIYTGRTAFVPACPPGSSGL